MAVKVEVSAIPDEGGRKSMKLERDEGGWVCLPRRLKPGSDPNLEWITRGREEVLVRKEGRIELGKVVWSELLEIYHWVLIEGPVVHAGTCATAPEAKERVEKLVQGRV